MSEILLGNFYSSPTFGIYLLLLVGKTLQAHSLGVLARPRDDSQHPNRIMIFYSNNRVLFSNMR